MPRFVPVREPAQVVEGPGLHFVGDATSTRLYLRSVRGGIPQSGPLVTLHAVPVEPVGEVAVAIHLHDASHLHVSFRADGARRPRPRARTSTRRPKAETERPAACAWRSIAASSAASRKTRRPVRFRKTRGRPRRLGFTGRRSRII